jgi:hypothetical protein
MGSVLLARVRARQRVAAVEAEDVREEAEDVREERTTVMEARTLR